MVIEVLSSIMKKTFAGALIALSVVALAGCTSGKTYSDVAALKAAFLEAGGECDPAEVLDSSKATVGEASILKGMEGIACGGAVGIFQFPSGQARDYFIQQIENTAAQSNAPVKLVVGSDWLIGGPKLDNEKFATALGGTARY
ncbi:MAG: hypothetical protein RL510_1110 [Actinomycetota bacterium]